MLIALFVATCGLAGRSLQHAQELGTITFPTSSAAAAQPAFLSGVKSLHSFQFDEAADYFRGAQKLDPAFALAFWGEAMSVNHPLWAEQDTDAGKAILNRLAPTRAGRLAKASTEKEKAWLAAVDVLFNGPGDKLARDVAYSDEMRRLYERYPDDEEVATFYALSLLGTVRPGDQGFRRQALTASIALKVFARNPKHPGAAHYIIHAFDDPDHAPLGLPAAEVYASVAPAAPHALHMPSHIFVQLGMWDRVAASNTTAYDAAVALTKRRSLPEGREDFHTLSWLAYADEMRGLYDKANASIELARATAERNPSNPRVREAYLSMQARYIVESGRWVTLPVGGTTADAGADHVTHGGMNHNYNGNADYLVAAGLGAIAKGDLATADRAAAGLAALRVTLEAGPNPYRARFVAIMEREVSGSVALARGDRERADALLKEAATMEMALDKPSGPPDPLKPATELYGEALLRLDRAAEARTHFQQSLLRTPRRPPSLLGLARASAKTGDLRAARDAYAELTVIWSAAPADFAPLVEAKAFLAGSETARVSARQR